MAEKALITFCSDEVADRLKQEDNSAALVEALLAKHFDMSIPNVSVASDQRNAILKELGGNYSEPSTQAEEVTNITEQEPIAVHATDVVKEEAAPAQDGTVVIPITTAPPVDPMTGFVRSDVPSDLVPEVDPSTPEPEPTPEEQVVEALDSGNPGETAALPEIPVYDQDNPKPQETQTEESPQYPAGSKVSPATGNRICPTCGEEMVTDICLNCL